MFGVSRRDTGVRMTVAQALSARKSLAEASAPAHLALHGHPWISRLAASDLQIDTYAIVLSAYRAFFARIEASRNAAEVFPELSLTDQVRAMDRDITALGRKAKQIDITAYVPFHSHPVRVLGTLYVLHGAGFGARTLSKSIESALPAAPRRYLSLGTSVYIWRALTAQLEALDVPEQSAVHLAAIETFNDFGNWVTVFCEAQQEL